MQLILVKDCEIVYQFSSDNAKEVLRDYKRISRNAWRRKSAFMQVEYPLKHYMHWLEVPRKGDRIPRTGVHSCYVRVSHD